MTTTPGPPTLFDQAGDREFHPLTRILPPVDTPEAERVIDAISASLRASRNYLPMDPVTVDHEGRIVDGRLRYLACLRTGTEPVYETLGAHYTDQMILDLIRSRNRLRRHLTADQRAMLLTEYESFRAALPL